MGYENVARPLNNKGGILQDAKKGQTSYPPNPGAPGRALPQARPQRAIIFQGVAGMIPTARVQRGPSEAARCASTGIVPATPPLFSILPAGER